MSEAVSAFPEAGSVEGEQAAAPWRPPPAVAPVWPEVWEMPPGVLPRQRLREAERLGVIGTTGVEIPEASFQPASLDLHLGPTAYRISSSFLPGRSPVRERLRDLLVDNKGFDIRSGGILEPNRPYLIPLMEDLRLPQNVRAFANPKSSTGRVDIFTRVVTDYSHRFDEISSGYEGGLWLEVFSRSFLVKVHAGMTLNQLRFVVEDPSDGGGPPDLPPSAPEAVRVQLRPPPQEPDLGETAGGPMPVGFKAKRHNNVLLDLAQRDHDPREFWEPVEPCTELVLHPEDFYLLRSHEQIAIPGHLAAEMLPFDATSGELRTHYAGFFDPGFGTGVPSGLPAVLEVRAHDVPFIAGRWSRGSALSLREARRTAGSPLRTRGRLPLRRRTPVAVSQQALPPMGPAPAPVLSAP